MKINLGGILKTIGRIVSSPFVKISHLEELATEIKTLFLDVESAITKLESDVDGLLGRNRGKDKPVPEEKQKAEATDVKSK